MKTNFLKLLSGLFLAYGTSTRLSAQVQMIVTLNNNNTETFALSEIRSLKFGTQTLNLNKSNGSISTWNLSDIANYRFVGLTGSGELKNTAGKLEVFPNPAGNQTRISFSAAHNQQISVEILDLQGKKIRNIYAGNHDGEQSFFWQVDVPKGMYLCRVATENGILTKSLIIN
jgi:hypothetical protein